MGHMEERSGRYGYVGNDLYEEMPFSVNMAGVDRCTPKYYLKRENSPISVVGFVKKGCGVVVQNGKSMKAEEGDLFLVNCRDSHEYYPDGEWEFFWVNIYGEYWREILVQYRLEQQIVFKEFRWGQEFVERIRNITEKKEDLHTWQIEMQVFLLKVILYLYKEKKFQIEDSLAGKIKTVFEKNIYSGKSQEEICKELGMTARHAQRVFKQGYGETIHDFLADKKMQQAKGLLVNTNNSVKYIALECGFDNEKYFSAFFHKKEGLSPTEYRRMYGFAN